MKTQQKGFTLIELIIVIVVLGILAVTAAPQFFNFSSDARKSTVEGLAGAVNSAKDIIHGKALIEGLEKEAAATTTEGIKIVYGYPEASEDGIIAALNLSADEWGSEKVIDAGTSSEVANGDLIIFPNDKESKNNLTDTDAQCYVIYKEATYDATLETFTPAKVSTLTTGC